MAKILLVEDDNNLREIYQARLMAEGYEISTAQNGEEALVVAKQQKPDLIISDVMMPRISGFEMLDILRNTAELKNTKVIMLTALGQDDDQKRADNLGADRYLVKSQVTLEDIVNTAKELLSGDSSAAAPRPQSAPASNSLAVAPAAPGIAAVAHVPDPSAPGSPAVASDAPASAIPPIPQPAPVTAAPASAPAAAPADPVAVASPADLPAVPSAPAGTQNIAPPETITAVSSVAAPAAAELEPPTPTGPTAPATPPTPSTVNSAAQGLEAEEAALQAQIASYANTPPASDSHSSADAADNDQALADAVKQLNTPDNSSGPASAPALNTEPSVTTAGAAGAGNDSTIPSPGRKSLQPISDPATKPDLSALLAKEDAKSPTTPPASADSGTPPAPGAPAGSTPSGKGFDPNTSL